MANFQKLSPYISNQNNIYKEAFDFVFDNDDLKNIAVSGAYGAGKSSVFESYMHYHREEEKIIHISLAHFEQLETCGEGTRSEDEANLEAKIINQLIHQIAPTAIKKTSFIAQIKHNNYAWVKTLLILIAILITLFFIFIDTLRPTLSSLTWSPFNVIFEFFLTSNGLLVVSFILIIITFFFILSIMQHSKENNPLRHFSFKNFNIDLSSDDDTKSFFDKYLSEVRYLFKNCGSTVIAIEDIDRYLSSSIFEKIRELNTIINYNKKKVPIRFFYIIKDDIFTSKDRTKFFDFIIPIVPILDSSNSYSQLKSQLANEMKGLNFNNRFLRGLSIYIDDMRVLKNIVNEFIVYQRQLADEELTPNKLLAIITYKNIFPKDFNDLQAGTGYLFNLIKSRDKLAKQFIKAKRERLTKIHEERISLNNEHLKNIDELSVLYLQPTANMERISNKNIEAFNTQLELYREIKSHPAEISVRRNSSISSLDLTNKLKALQNNPEFLERKRLLEQKEEKALQTLAKEQRDIEKDIQNITDSHLISKLIDTSNIDDYLKMPQNGNEEKYKDIIDDLHFLIVPFLIRYGMIDGNYEDYLTYFYDSELKINDQRFIRSVFDEKPLSNKHKLTNPQAVLEILEDVSESNPAYINKDLFFYVFDERIQNEASSFIRLFKKQTFSEIIKNYLNTGTHLDLLISTLNDQWNSFYSDIVIGFNWPQEEKDLFLRQELLHGNPNSIKVIEAQNTISMDITSNDTILSEIPDEKEVPVKENLIAIEVKFQDLNSLLTSDQILKGIYENDLYELSIPNIQFWLKQVYKATEEIREGALLSVVFSKPNEPLSIYVSDNLNSLLLTILTDYPNTSFNDNQNTIWKILESPKVDLDVKNKYIERLAVKVKDIRRKNDQDLLNLLMLHDKVTFSLNNLLTLFTTFDYEFTQEFSSYLTKHEEESVKDKQFDSSLFSKEVLNEFFNTTLNDISLNKLVTETLLNATRKKLTSPINVSNIEKAEALISSRALVMNKDNLAFIRSIFPELTLFFEKENIDDFKNLLDTETDIDSQEIVDLLESDLNFTEQKNLLSHVNGKVPYKSSYNYYGIKKYIIKYKFEISDIKAVLSDPISRKSTIFPLVINKLVKNFDYIIKEHIVLPYDFYLELKNNQSVSYDQKVESFSNSIKTYNLEQIEQTIRDLKISPFFEMFCGKHPKLENTSTNQKLITGLTAKKIASLSKINGRLYLKKHRR